MAAKTVTLLSSAAVGAAGVNSADQTNRTGRGVVVAVKKTANSGTNPTLTVTIQGKAGTGDYYTLLASAALTADATTYYTVYPGLTAAANVTATNVLPRVWRVSCAIGGTATPTVTFSVTADVID